MMKDLDMYFSGNNRAYVQAGLRMLDGAKAFPKAILRGNGVRTFWGFRNFGDLITPLLLEQVGKTPINCPHPAMTNMMMVGSILDPLSSGYRGTILGTGFLNEDRSFNATKADVVAVRGLLTKERLKVRKNVALGDPGLLMSAYFNTETSKKFKVGLVPHYSEFDDARVMKLLNRFSGELTLIDVLDSPLSVYNKISQCEIVLSSSLHGLVFADSLDIPNVWISLSGRSRFKYDDYYTAYDVCRDPYQLTGDEGMDDLFNKAERICRADVLQVRDELQRIFLEYCQ
ncbi:polysaccharide pyruvyl transferase family protein [Marinobacter shengliensis]|uniref:polysaccharide pyruvyl transferase family protein n=1 Tax=Marinobacter shengliensis TaxID=1389223 RepID=UPI0011087756|nr:polysaccharide pyruvyl transferase family protein [Marinobacter shengliensis]